MSSLQQHSKVIEAEAENRQHGREQQEQNLSPECDNKHGQKDHQNQRCEAGLEHWIASIQLSERTLMKYPSALDMGN
jgi:hypothetical protein